MTRFPRLALSFLALAGLSLAGCPAEADRASPSAAPSSAGPGPKLTAVRLAAGEGTSAITVDVRNGLDRPIALLGFSVGSASTTLRQELRGERTQEGRLRVDRIPPVASREATIGDGNVKAVALPVLPAEIGVWNGYTSGRGGGTPLFFTLEVPDADLTDATLTLEYAYLDPGGRLLKPDGAHFENGAFVRLEASPSEVAEAARWEQIAFDGSAEGKLGRLVTPLPPVVALYRGALLLWAEDAAALEPQTVSVVVGEQRLQPE